MPENRGRPRGPTEEDVLEVLKETTEPVLTAGEIAEELPISKRTVLRRLANLEAEDRVNVKQAGNARVWYLHEGEPKGLIEEPDNDEAEDEIATDGALSSSTDLNKVDELLETQNKMYEDYRRSKIVQAKRDWWAAVTIVPFVFAMIVIFIQITTQGALEFLNVIGGLAMFVSFVGAVVWVYVRVKYSRSRYEIPK